MTSFHEIAEKAAVIVNGYALQKIEKGIRVVNIHKPTHTAIFSEGGELLETSMDDIELHIAQNYYEKGLPYMEEENAEVL